MPASLVGPGTTAYGVPRSAPPGAGSAGLGHLPDLRPGGSERVGRIDWLTVALVIGLAVAGGHGWSVVSGLYLDDHAHHQHLREGDWSFRSAVDSAELGIVGDVLDLWGRREAGLRFFRPIAFWIMRAEYTLGGWRPEVVHLFSLLWHFTACMLAAVLAQRCLGQRFWAMVAALLMALHPNHVTTVYWIACQTELMTTVFLLAGVLAYSRHAGWGWGPPPQAGDRHRAQGGVADGVAPSAATPAWRPWFGGDPADRDPDPRPAWSPRAVTGWAIAAVVCYALALGCRENAILFPLACWLGDILCGSPRRRWRWEHAAMLLVAGGYLALRHQALGGFPVPPPPYLVRPEPTAAFALYLLEKAGVYVLGLFCFIPIVPIGSQVYFAQRPEVFYGLFAAVLAALAAVWAAYRFRPALLWPAAWLGCMFLPVIPVFASPHHLYLPGVGMALIAAAALRLPTRLRPHAAAPGRAGAAVGHAVPALLLAVTGTLTWCMGFAFVKGTLAEDLFIRDVLECGDPPREGDELFFINMPVLAYYCVPAIRHQLGLRDLRGHVLTFSPDLLGMSSPGEVEVLDRHRLRLRIRGESRYLQGTTGDMLLGAMGMRDDVARGRPVDAGLFTVVPTDVDAHGVRELELVFRAPLDSPHYRFYLGSPKFMAYPLDMSRLVRAAVRSSLPQRAARGLSRCDSRRSRASRTRRRRSFRGPRIRPSCGRAARGDRPRSCS